MLLDNIGHMLKSFLPTRGGGSGKVSVEQTVAALKSIGFDDFLVINMPPREMLLAPILP
jgi:hypothetical protein